MQINITRLIYWCLSKSNENSQDLINKREIQLNDFMVVPIFSPLPNKRTNLTAFVWRVLIHLYIQPNHDRPKKQ